MSYQDLLVTIWQLVFHCFSSKPCSGNNIMYGMQHIEMLAKIVFGIKRDTKIKGIYFWNSVTQHQRVFMTRNLWWTFLMKM